MGALKLLRKLAPLSGSLYEVELTWLKVWSPSRRQVTSDNSDGRCTGIGESSNARITPYMAVFAPSPTASERTATRANPGLRRSTRNEYRKSNHTPRSII